MQYPNDDPKVRADRIACEKNFLSEYNLNFKIYSVRLLFGPQFATKMELIYIIIFDIIGHNRIPVNPPTVTVKERTADEVSFTVAPPSDHVQIVAMVNEHISNEIVRKL